jgi:hypothetical protein
MEYRCFGRPTTSATPPSRSRVRAASRPSSIALPLAATRLDQARDLAVRPGVERLERQVLELPLDLLDAEAVRERRVDLEGLGRDPSLPVGREHRERAHVVQPVGELDEQDADVARHRDDHLADVLSLLLLPTLRNSSASSFVRPSTDPRYIGAELRLELVDGDVRVLDRVVQERGDQRRGIQTEVREDLRDRERVVDEVLARDPLLALVAELGEAVGTLDLLQVGLRVVPADRTEQALEPVPRRLDLAGPGSQARQDAATALLFDLLMAVHGDSSRGKPVYAGSGAEALSSSGANRS